MFGIFSSKKQNSLKNPVYLEKFINNAYLELSNSIKTPNELYLFLIEELCGASQGNNDGKQLVDFSQFHEIEYRNALNKESAMDLPNSPLSILNNSVSPQLIKELGIDEAVKIRCKLIKRLIEANQNTLNSSRLTFAKSNIQMGSSYLSEGEIQAWFDVINSIQGASKKTILEPDDLTEIITPSNHTAQGKYYDMFKDLEDYLSSLYEQPSHSTFMPLLYALRIAYAGMYSQGICSKADFDAVDQGFFNRVILIGQSISREEQVSFQEASLDKALEWINKYYIVIDRQTSSHLVNTAKSGL